MGKMEIHRSDLQVIHYEAEKYLMQVVVSPNTKYIGDESFQEAQRKILALSEEYLPTRMLINLQDLLYTIPPEMQEWTAKEIIPTLIELCVKRLAYIIPNEFYAQLSVEQLVSEIPALNFVTAFFMEEKVAIEWLCEK
ncbi:MAG: hypothetical protein EAZ08_00245 [Cytophagales bacterium]|nr:MAG: hypothetical protein EAZ08_00245 [Cytophagales bacterium]